uniref:RNA polymerase I-specific transcription initiation factor RRN3 n=1 Tax=Panagrellus redivivus TaxID=6233 RepID=A0A7E4VD86_PANRE
MSLRSSEARRAIIETGEDILKVYNKGHPDGIIKYKQICELLLTFDNWNDKAKVDFFEKFFPFATLFEDNCKEIVDRLVNLKWLSFNDELRPRFVQFLTDIATVHVFHTDTILQCFFKYLLPLEEFDFPESMGPDDVDDKLPRLALEAISYVYMRLNVSGDCIMKNARKSFPFHSSPVDTLVVYIQRLIILADAVPDLSQKFWSLIIEKMLYIDAMISKTVVALQDTEAVVPTYIAPEFIARDAAYTERMDKLMIVVLARLSKGREVTVSQLSSDPLAKWYDNTNIPNSRDIFEQLWPAFVDLVLNAHEVQTVPFIWFYLCSVESKYLNFMMKVLWKLVSTPIFAPCEWKRAQNAASFLGGFLARARYIEFPEAVEWMKRMADWSRQYIDKTELSRNCSGSIQHGTFYSVIQSLLYVFSSRYKEFIEHGCVQDVHTWCFQRIVHNNFNPLKYISPVIARGFAAISRRLQIVYCCHIIDSNPCESPIEHFLPFSSIQMPTALDIVLPLHRQFLPAEEDADIIPANILDLSKEAASAGQQVSDDDDYGFLDDDDDAMDTTAPISIISPKHNADTASAFASSPFQTALTPSIVSHYQQAHSFGQKY